jgi:hypothetical protein
MDGNKTKAKRQAVKELRKVKLVIGNGFDLQCGLHSSYADYFKNVQHLMDSLSEWDRLFTSVENYLHDTTANNFWRQPQYFDVINTWDCFFYYRANSRIDSINWCDIEKEMLDSFTLTKYSFFWDEVYSLGENKYYTPKKKEHNRLMVAAFIRRKRNEQWFVNKQEFYFFLLDELKKFELRFGDFIKEQQTEEYKKNYENLVVSLCNYSNLTSIDSFNYSVFEQEGYRQININGNYSMPIFGIDSQRVTTNAPYYIFSKTYRRIENDTENKRFDVDPEFENVIVYGHSLCENDYSYFFPIMDKLKLYDFTAEGQIVFAYRVYDKERESEIKTKYRLAIASLIEAYAVYRGIPQPNRLLDSLSIFNRVWLYELETIVKVMPIGRTTISAEIKIETK